MIPNVFVPGTPSQRVDGGHDGLGGQKGMPGLGAVAEDPRETILPFPSFSLLRNAILTGGTRNFLGGAHFFFVRI